MTSQKEGKMLEKVLNLPGVIVKGYQKIEGVGWAFQVESESKEGICPRCGEKSRKLPQNHWYLVKYLPVCGEDVYLQVNRRQWKCSECRKPFSEELDWLKKRKNIPPAFCPLPPAFRGRSLESLLTRLLEHLLTITQFRFLQTV